MGNKCYEMSRKKVALKEQVWSKCKQVQNEIWNLNFGNYIWFQSSRSKESNTLNKSRIKVEMRKICPIEVGLY